mgnify:CR=1 FL=1
MDFYVAQFSYFGDNLGMTLMLKHPSRPLVGGRNYYMCKGASADARKHLKKQVESPRILRRLKSLRGLSHEQDCPSSNDLRQMG